jgi:hypothetical protein
VDSDAEPHSPVDLKRRQQYKPRNPAKLTPEEKLRQERKERRKEHQERRGISPGSSTPRGIQRESSITSEHTPSSPSPLTTTSTPSEMSRKGEASTSQLLQTPRPVQNNLFAITPDDMQRMITEISAKIIQTQTNATTAPPNTGVSNRAGKFPVQTAFSGKPDQLEPTI